MNNKFFKIYRMIIYPLMFLIIGFLIYSYFPKNSKPYNVTREEKIKVLNLINHEIPDFEKTAKKNIENDKRKKNVYFGKYDWHVYKRSGNIYYALFGYFGYQKMDKIIAYFFQKIINWKLNRSINLSLNYFLTIDLNKKTIEGTNAIDTKPAVQINSDL